MKALESLNLEKQIDLSESRNKAKTAWNELQIIYDNLEPSKKANIMADLMQKNL